MPTPDELAAALPVSTWKDRPLPATGHKIKITYPVRRHGRTTWDTALGVVQQIAQPSDTGMVITLDTGKSYLIDSSSLLDKWEHVSDHRPARQEQVIIDHGDPQKDTDRIEHENRLANDPAYRQQWEMISEKIALGSPHVDRDEANPFGEDLSDEPEQNIAPGIPDPYADSLAARMRRLEWLDDQMKSLGAQVDGLKAEYDQLCAATIEHMAHDGVPSITVDGNTWYMKSKTFVEKLDGVTTDDIREALISAGYGSMLTQTYNSNSLRSLLAEFEGSDGQIPVPDALAAVVRLGRTTTIGRTRAAARKRKSPTSPPS